MQNSESLLKSKNLRVTKVRKSVLEALQNEQKALNQQAIAAIIPHTVDRVTLYRTLHSFIESGLVHSIATNDLVGGPVYALCEDNCNEHKHLDQHLHFTCINCGETTCLHEVTIAVPNLPNNYTIQKTMFSIEGICANCNS